jgi:hypothetical protein
MVDRRIRYLAPMPSLATDADIVSIPKVELHIHLNGSITEATASELARRHGADPVEALQLVNGRYPGHYPNFGGFLDAYLLANGFVITTSARHRTSTSVSSPRSRRIQPRSSGATGST